MTIIINKVTEDISVLHFSTAGNNFSIALTDAQLADLNHAIYSYLRSQEPQQPGQ